MRFIICLFLLFVPAAMISSSAQTSGKVYYEGRCRSSDTGTDFGFVRGSSQSELTEKCKKNAVNPVISNGRTVACVLTDQYTSCESDNSVEYDPGATNPSVAPPGSYSGREVMLEKLEMGRACFAVPPGTKISHFNFVVDRTNGCEFVKGSKVCPWAISQKLTKVTGNVAGQLQDVYCWTVWNEDNHRASRSFALFAQ